MGKRKKADTVSAKKQAKPSKSGKVNPFEVRVNRKKYDILGQKSKSDRGLPGVSRSKAIQKRKKTLLLEYKQRNKSNLFIDRRFGEYDEGLSPEERMMRRFVLEKQKRHNRAGLFNLEEEGEGLTHYGQSLGDMERFDDIQISEGEEDEEDIGETHFGGFLKRKRPRVDKDEEEEEKPRTRKEIMEEVITKSKASKFERQAEKREVENLLDQMDSEWRDISSILKTTSSEKAAKSDVADDYDRAVRELVFEKRGQPTDRMKSQEELAREERERLEKLEANRLRRMKGLPSRSQEDTEHLSADFIFEKPLIKRDDRVTLRYEDGKIVLPEGADSTSPAGTSSGREAEVSGEESSGEGEGEMSEDEDSNVEDSEDSDQSEEDEVMEGNSEIEDEALAEEESDQNPAETYGSDLESEDEGEEVSSPSKSGEEGEGSGGEEEGRITEEAVREQTVEELTRVREEAAKELPYTFEVPRSLMEFRTIVDHRSPEECQTAVDRIYTCNHPSLGADNKRELEQFLAIVVEFSLQLGQEPTMSKLATLSHLARPLFKLAQLNSVHTAGVFRKLLKDAHKRWSKHRKGHPKYPPFSDLLLFKLIGLLFPTSDFKHPIVTPAMLFMGQLLLRCHVDTISDLICGLFLCQVLREYVSLSRRFVPEVLNFIISAAGCFTESRDCVFYPPFSPKSKLRRQLSQCSSQEGGTADYNVLQLLVLSSEVSTVQHTKYAVLRIILELAGQLSELYEGLPSFTEIFTPLSTNIQSIADQEWSQEMKERYAGVVRLLAAKCGVPRVMLQMLKQKPKSIKFYEPKFDEKYVVGRKRAGSRTTAERQKLRHKVKREMKGAVREIRKDNVFLAKEKLKETLERDAERERKTKKILHDLQMQQFEAKMEKIKKR